MFIVCGVLYAVDSATERTTRVRLAFDLYQNKLLEVALPFTNPFRKTTVLAYNHRNRVRYILSLFPTNHRRVLVASQILCFHSQNSNGNSSIKKPQKEIQKNE